MILIVSDTILIMEQFLFEIKNPTQEIYKILLQKNRDIVHGAFVLDHSKKKVIFRDTLPVDNMGAKRSNGFYRFSRNFGRRV